MRFSGRQSLSTGGEAKASCIGDTMFILGRGERRVGSKEQTKRQRNGRNCVSKSLESSA